MNVWTIATLTLREALRKKVVYIFLFVAILMIILSQAFAFFADPSGMGGQKAGDMGVANASRVELIVIKSMAFGVIVLAGAVMSIFLGTDLIPSDIDRKTIYTLLSKPVRRGAYLAGKQLGLSLTLGVNIGLMGLAFLVLLFLKTFRFPIEILVGVLLIWVQFIMLGSVALFFSVFVSRNINAALTFFIFVVGSLSDFLQEIVNSSARSGNHALAILLRVVKWIIPNFADFNATNPLIHSEQLAQTNFYQYVFAKVIPLGILYSLMLLIVAFVIFDRREL